MRRALLLGSLVFVAVIIARAPAGILRSAVASSGAATLLEPTGTLWDGEAQLLIQRQPVGRVRWSLDAVTLLQGKLGYHLRLDGTDHDLTGQAAVSFAGLDASVSGHIAHGAVNPWLAPYNILLSGDFDLDDVAVGFENARPASAAGQINWSGGPVTYTLAGTTSTGNLPEMTASLGPGPEALVVPTGSNTPLLKLRLLDSGFVSVGVTKLLTKMLNSPWPGADPDHAVVLEVEEQVF